MFVAEAEAIDVDDFVWMVYNRKTAYKSQPQQYNPKHTLVLNQGDVYGMLRTRKKVYQLVKADAQHVLFRNIVPSIHDKLFKDSLPYRGTIDQQRVDEGFERARRVSTVQNEAKRDIRTSPFFVPSGRIDEREELDYSNYQWRKVIDQVKLESKKQGVTKKVLSKNELIGLRYVSPSVGGYVIHDSNKRVMVSTEMYVDLTDASKLLPLSQQLEGKVNVFNPRSKVPTPKKGGIVPRRQFDVEPVSEEVEEPIVPKYDFSNVSPLDFFKSKRVTRNQASRTERAITNIQKAPDLPEWEGDDVEELFEDDDGVEENVKEPVKDEPEEADDVEEEFDDEEQEDSEDSEEESPTSPLADVLVAGRMFSMNNREFAVIQSGVMERNPKLVEYIVHENNSDDEELYRFRLADNYTLQQFEEKGYTILENEMDDSEIDKLQLLLDDAKFKPLPLAK
jgi:hypothetical protein